MVKPLSRVAAEVEAETSKRTEPSNVRAPMEGEGRHRREGRRLRSGFIIGENRRESLSPFSRCCCYYHHHFLSRQSSNASSCDQPKEAELILHRLNTRNCEHPCCDSLLTFQGQLTCNSIEGFRWANKNQARKATATSTMLPASEATIHREQKLQTKLIISNQRRHFNHHKNVLILLFPFILVLLLAYKDTSKCDNERGSQGTSAFVQAQALSLPTTTVQPMFSAGRQKFRGKPREIEKLEEVMNLIEGESILLRCEVDNQEGNAQWTKNEITMFHHNRTRMQGFDRFEINGDPAKGDHSLELRGGARLEDEGHYECQILPFTDSGRILRAVTNITVRPSPPPPPVTSIVSSTPAASSTTNQPSLESSQLSVRDIPTSLSAKQHQSLATNHQSPASAFITSPVHLPAGSTAASSSQSPQHNSLILMFNWPHMLLLIAGVLMLVNIYIIYSLIKRHTKSTNRNAKSSSNNSNSSSTSSNCFATMSNHHQQQRQKQHGDRCSAELESSSNGGSSQTGSAATTSSRLAIGGVLNGAATTTASLTPLANELEGVCGASGSGMQQCIELPIDSYMSSLNSSMLSSQQQLHASNTINTAQNQYTAGYQVNRICMAANQQQQQAAWNGHEFVAIDANGWVLEI